MSPFPPQNFGAFAGNGGSSKRITGRSRVSCSFKGPKTSLSGPEPARNRFFAKDHQDEVFLNRTSSACPSRKFPGAPKRQGSRRGKDPEIGRPLIIQIAIILIIIIISARPARKARPGKKMFGEIMEISRILQKNGKMKSVVACKRALALSRSQRRTSPLGHVGGASTFSGTRGNLSRGSVWTDGQKTTHFSRNQWRR